MRDLRSQTGETLVDYIDRVICGRRTDHRGIQPRFFEPSFVVEPADRAGRPR